MIFVRSTEKKIGLVFFNYEDPAPVVVSRGPTLFHTEGKSRGYGHRATCRPAPWSAYQHSTVFSHMIPEVRD